MTEKFLHTLLATVLIIIGYIYPGLSYKISWSLSAKIFFKVAFEYSLPRVPNIAYQTSKFALTSYYISFNNLKI
jgi:hypothetical protein